MNTKLNFRYSMSQILFCVMLCVTLGFGVVYLQDKGFTNSVIGVVMALGFVLATFLQPVLADYADKTTYKNVNTLIVGMFLSAGTLLLIMFLFDLDTFIIGIIFVVNIAFSMTITPLLNSLAFSFEKVGYKVNFGLARGLGSASYAIFSFILGIIAGYSVKLLPLVNFIACLLGALFVRLYSIKEIENVVKTKEKAVEQLSLKEFVFKYKRFMVLVIGVVFVTFGHILINNFFISIINNVGGNSRNMGTAIFIAAMVELPTMIFFERIIRRFKIGSLVKFSLIMYAIKHLITYFAPNVFIIYLAQVLQMFAYALYLPAGVYYVHKVIDENDQIKGQSLMNLAMTVGGLFASLIGGVLLDNIGVSTTLLISAILSFVGVAIAYKNVEIN